MSWKHLASPSFLVAMLVMVAAALSMSGAIRAYGLHLAKKPIYAPGGRTLHSLPIETARWKRFGADIPISAEEQTELGTDNFVSRQYVEKGPADGATPRTIQLHAAYYTNQIDTVPHVPERCFVGGGLSIVSVAESVALPLDTSAWLPDRTVTDEELAGRVFTTRLPNDHPARPGERVRLPLDPKSLSMRITEYKDRYGRHLFAGYFFIANGGWVASAEGVRTLAFDLTNDYAYYMKVQFASDSVGSPEELAAAAANLLDDLFGDLMLCVPDWVEVRRGTYP